MLKNLIPWKKPNSHLDVRRDEPHASNDDVYPLARLRSNFDSLVHRFFEDDWMGSRNNGKSLSPFGQRFDWNWDLGWEDRGKAYVYQTELPGFEPEDFDVKISGRILTIHAEHKDEKNEKNGLTSYRYGSFSRSLTLPVGAVDSKIDARYHSGILEIHIPKTKDAQGKRIEVKPA